MGDSPPPDRYSSARWELSLQVSKRARVLMESAECSHARLGKMLALKPLFRLAVCDNEISS